MEANQIVDSIAGYEEQAPLDRVHIDVPGESEDDALEALEDVIDAIDNEAYLACDVLELLNSQDLDNDKPSFGHSDYEVDDPTLSSTANAEPMIERELWLFDDNPVGSNNL